MGKGVAPRFVLTGSESARAAEILGIFEWRPQMVELDPALLRGSDLERADVVVVACTERELLTPRLQDAVARLAERVPRVAMVHQGGPDVAAHVARLGWQGCVAADEGPAMIRDAIASAAGGQLSFPASATAALARALARVAPFKARSSEVLTPRQRQIVALIAQGATDAEVAMQLRISESTARKHVLNARRRLNARTRSQLVAASREHATAFVVKAG